MSRWSLVDWGSGHLRRVVEPTLASETQALTVGLKEMEWVCRLGLELTEGLTSSSPDDPIWW